MTEPGARHPLDQGYRRPRRDVPDLRVIAILQRSARRKRWLESQGIRWGDLTPHERNNWIKWAEKALGSNE